MKNKQSSKYWDDFKRREKETLVSLIENKPIKVRRVAVFITDKCNFNCDYCNVKFGCNTLSKNKFDDIVKKYGQDAIIHITGGEPSVVKWLYNYIEKTPNVKFHLNSNCFLNPPRNIKRLKVSLDTSNPEYFNSLVGRKNVFKKVIKNIQYACTYTTTSITYTLTRENYKDAPAFMEFCKTTFKGLYAVFFSVYKGNNKRFVFQKEDVDNFFDNIRYKLQDKMDSESLRLFRETIDEKFRLIQGIRFPESDLSKPCYLSLSERVFDAQGNEFRCSHLYRDGICHVTSKKHNKCLYGCNRRLVKFNQDIEKRLKNQIIST